ncbi:hypothetical protein [Siphonobacter curvatus]|uniref:Uncharacterized protein n=1 Tax=Siphonobacter curvatus TaxID=2094562 RepID=A0A2S7IJ58_9BACT|nr:hypothetical protein [Siphonobacter curvatus]PQA56749.1 hypothetical protein C5O19_15520 [Siphonobacter curvatus]
MKKQYEILPSLPPYGPMYIPLTPNDTRSNNPYSEGFVVRFFTSSEESWVANFTLGATSFYQVFEFPQTDVILVIAGGMGYAMNRNQFKPLSFFGYSITKALRIDSSEVVIVECGSLIVINSKGEELVNKLVSETTESDVRGESAIKDLSYQGRIVHGYSYDSRSKPKEWVTFTLDLDSGRLNGGSYLRYYYGEDEFIAVEKKNWWKSLFNI